MASWSPCLFGSHCRRGVSRWCPGGGCGGGGGGGGGGRDIGAKN